MESMRIGDPEMAYLNDGAISAPVPEFSVVGLPYLWTSIDAAHEALYGDFGEYLNQKLPDGCNIISLGTAGAGNHSGRNLRRYFHPHRIRRGGYSLIAGCFIDNISSCVILTPILLPIVTGIGMDPIHFGIVMTVNLAIGFITPPYGCNLFFASAISDVPVTKIVAKSLPMILIMIGVLMLLTFIHALSIGVLG